MKKLILLATLSSLLAAPALAAPGHHAHTPRHGGVLASGKAADFELVARADVIQLFVDDHGKPVDVSAGSAKLTLLNGTHKQEVELKPVDGRLEARGTFQVANGTKAIVVVTNGGKALGTARFTLK